MVAREGDEWTRFDGWLRRGDGDETKSGSEG